MGHKGQRWAPDFRWGEMGGKAGLEGGMVGAGGGGRRRMRSQQGLWRLMGEGGESLRSRRWRLVRRIPGGKLTGQGFHPAGR